MAFAKRNGAAPKYRTPEHRRYLAQLKAQLRREGYLICTAKVCKLPTRRITNPNGRAWPDGLQAGHNDDGITYAGPQHFACNSSDAGRRARARQDHRHSQLEW